jgi:DNA-binding beta-propeller fold protein YncE
MRPLALLSTVAALSLALPSFAQTGPYKVLSTTKVGGEGGFDYVNADSAARRLYVARSGPTGHIMVFDLDTLKQVGDIPSVSAHGVAVDEKSHMGFATSKPVSIFNTKTLADVKPITTEGNPDGLLADPETGHVYILSHSTPNVTVLNGKDGAIVGTVDLGGAPEQAALDGKGHMYIDLEDKGSIAVVDTKALKLTATYDLQGKGGTCAGLALDTRHGILFAACRTPQTMVMLDAKDGKILDTLPIGQGTDGAVFNPKTMEAFSSQGDGTLTIIKENSPTSFAVEQTLTTLPRAKTLTLDEKTGHIILITAEFAPPPPTAPGGRPARGAMIPDTFTLIVVGK